MMNRQSILSVLAIGILILTAFFACEKKPTAPVRENPFDPKNKNFDDIPPKIILKINTLNGITNETEFIFDASQSFENEDKLFKPAAKWDLDGDGKYDEEFKRNNLIKKKIFDIGGGEKTIKLKILGAKGLTADTTFKIFVNTRPQAQFTARQKSYNPLIMYFDASASEDYEDGNDLQFRWDFDSDGIFDTNWLSEDTMSHEYTSVGSYSVKLNVRDQDQLIGELEITITVSYSSLIEMVYVSGGTFEMGCTSEQSGCEGYESPVHTVTLNSFLIGKYEITQIQYKDIMGTNPSRFKADNRPVERVSWYNAIKFCNKLSLRDGLEPCYTINGGSVTCDFSKNGYRLPTEAEWEYAARGGSEGSATLYAGSNNADDVAWYKGNSGSQTNEVGTKQPNELGLYDMSGNVWEWCWDWFVDNYYSSSPQNNPKGPDTGVWRVMRGGSWYFGVNLLRVASRSGYLPDYIYEDYGFRIVRRP